MFPRSGAIFGFALFALIASSGTSAGAEGPSKSADYYRGKLDSIKIPRLIWKQVKQEEAFDEWSKLVRQYDESRQGIPLSLATTLAGDTVLNERAWDVSARELLAHVCVKLDLQYRVTDRGIEIIQSKYRYASNPSAEQQPEATRVFTLPDTFIRNAKDAARFVNEEGLKTWQEHAVSFVAAWFPEGSKPAVQWAEYGKSIRVKADPQILDGISEMLNQRMHGPPPALNAGEEKLLAQFAPWEHIRLPEIAIDAPTARDALDKLLAAVQRRPGGEYVQVDWKISDARLAEAGPVHYEHPSQQRRAAGSTLEPVPASQILAEVLATFDGTLRTNEDGSWEIAPARLGEQTGLSIVEYKVAPEILKRRDSNDPPTAISRNRVIARHIGGCGGVTFGPGRFAMYSPASNTLVIKDTIIAQLRVRKILNEGRPKPQPAKPAKKLNSKKR